MAVCGLLLFRYPNESPFLRYTFAFNLNPAFPSFFAFDSSFELYLAFFHRLHIYNFSIWLPGNVLLLLWALARLVWLSWAICWSASWAQSPGLIPALNLAVFTASIARFLGLSPHAQERSQQLTANLQQHQGLTLPGLRYSRATLQNRH